MARRSKASHPGQEGHRLAAIFHCISLVIHASFYTLLEQISMHYWSTFLYIIGAYFYTLLLAAGDTASLIAEDLLVAMYCPLGVIYSNHDGPCLPPRGSVCHGAPPLSLTDGENGPFPLRIQPRLSPGSQQGLCAFYFLFLCILNQPCKQATIGFCMNKNLCSERK